MTRMHDQVQFGNTTLQYKILRKPHRQTIEIKVHPDCSLTVSAPKGTRYPVIAEVVLRKADWVTRKQWQVSQLRKHTPRNFISGECFFYLGRQYQLKIHQNRNQEAKTEIRFRNSRFEVTVPASWSIRRKNDATKVLLAGWYRERAEAKIPKMLYRFSAQAGLNPSRLIIKDIKQRWGSCGKDGTIRINWRIILGDYSLVEYVVAHEVCHLAYKDHSPAFWKRLGKIMPDYENRREKLAREGIRYQL